MKIGLLTFHHGYNFGGFLQAYSLARYLRLKGHDTRIIDYVNARHRAKKMHSLFMNRNPLLTIHSLIRMGRFKHLQHDLPLTARVNDVRRLQDSFDVAVVGSDEVWNFSNPMFGYDGTYFGVDLPTQRLVAYGASFGPQADHTKLPVPARDSLRGFTNIGVRDKNSNRMIRQIRDHAPDYVCDPTFLEKDHLVEQASKASLSNKAGNNIVFYGVDSAVDPEKANAIRNYSRKVGKPLVSLGYRNRWCDRTEYDLTPWQWMRRIRDADTVVTSMFHGLVFAILFNKDFVFLMNDYRRLKADYLVEYLQIGDRVWHNGGQDALTSLLDGPLDYSGINARSEKLVKQSCEFLERSLR